MTEKNTADEQPASDLSAPPEDQASAKRSRAYGLIKYIIPLSAILLIFAWRLVFSFGQNLIPDECSYWTWSRWLDWSYFDNSGMVAYLIRLSTEILGYSSPFSVRLPFLILSVLTTYLIYSISMTLFGTRLAAIWTALLFNITPIALLGGSMAMHDNALLFFWSAALWAAAKFLASDDSKWFYAIGVLAGCCILSKYTGVLVIPGIFLFLLARKKYRPLLRQKEPWVGALIAAAFTLPIIWWNINHDWASLYHVLFIGSGAPDRVKRLLDGLGYHAAQFLLISPILYALLIFGLWRGLKSVFSAKPETVLLLCFSLPLPIFGLLAFKGHVEANWAVMGYISAVILAVNELWPKFVAWNKPERKLIMWAVAVSVVPVIIVVLHARVGLLPASIEKRVAKEDRVIWETLGWDKLGLRIKQTAAPEDVICADSYQLCALLEFNVPGQPEVRYLAPWKRPTQFDVRRPSFDDLKGRNLLFVTPVPLLPTSDVRTTIYENFAKIEELEPYEFIYHGEAIRKMHIYRGYGFDPFSPKRLGPRKLSY